MLTTKTLLKTVLTASLAFSYPSPGLAQADVEADAAAPAAVQLPEGFDNVVDFYSYAIGMNIAGSYLENHTTVNPRQIFAGLDAVYSGGQPLLDDAQGNQALGELNRLRRQTQADLKRVESDAVLKEQAARAGVETRESGLLVELLEAGDGPTAEAGQEVVLHYAVSLPGEDPFDSTTGHDPAVFQVDDLLPGLREGITSLPAGSKAKLYIPPDLAYGDDARTAGGGGQVLFFEVDIVEVRNPAPPPTIEEQIAQERAQLEEEIQELRDYTERRIEELKAQDQGDDGDASESSADE